MATKKRAPKRAEWKRPKPPPIGVGDSSIIRDTALVTGKEKPRIGRFVIVADHAILNSPVLHDSVIIRKGAMIGHKATILSRVRIPESCAIPAEAVVSSEMMVAAGNAKHYRWSAYHDPRPKKGIMLVIGCQAHPISWWIAAACNGRDWRFRIPPWERLPLAKLCSFVLSLATERLHPKGGAVKRLRLFLEESDQQSTTPEPHEYGG